MQLKTNHLFLACFIVLALTGCRDKSRFKIKTTESRIDVKIKRFDQALIQLDSKNPNAIKELYKQYPEFLPVYTSQILDIQASDTSKIDSLFRQFSVDKQFSNVNKKTMETFSDVTDIEKSISDAYTYIRHYFPTAKLPEIYFFVSGFNRSVLMTDKFIGIGTDFYLGADYPPYKDISYKYLLYNMRRECVATDIVSATLFRMFIINSDEDRLLEHMLFRGKVMYLLSVCMPDQTQASIMGYKPEQMEWCLKFEKDIWATMLDHKDLFSSDSQLIHKYLNDAPFTAPISQDSPGRLGTWIGLQIIESYMQSHPEIDLPTLMRESNYQKILQNSGYRP
jgi:hypothetical protein